MIKGKPRTTGLRPWLWGTAPVGSQEHSPRSNIVLQRARIIVKLHPWNGVHPGAHERGVLWYGVNSQSHFFLYLL